MNERIEKLAEQAGMIVDKYGLARDAENGLDDGVDIYKFAELIVAECIDVFSKDLPEEGDGKMLEVVNRVCAVAEHFGVEE